MRDQRRMWAGVAGTGLLGAAMLAGLAGCKEHEPQMTAVDAMSGADPSDANMAPVEASDAEAAAQGVGAPGYGAASTAGVVVPRQAGVPAGTARVAQSRRVSAGAVNESQAAAAAYAAGQAPAPVERRAPEYQDVPQAQQVGYQDGQQAGPQEGYDPSVQQGEGDDAQQLNAELDANLDPGQQADAPPPPLPEYEQPPAPGDDYLWTPGYWGYAQAGYYWVPGAWVSAPFVGALWTPGYWGPYRGHWCFHHGYWGRYVGFYGGVPYGFGYYGTGYHGGFWNGNHFAYNRAVTNVNVNVVRNVYNRTVVVNNYRINNSVTNRYVNNLAINNRVSYNGGRGGIQARPDAAEVAALRQRQVAPLAVQRENQRAAAANRGQFFAARQERPGLVVSRPLQAEHVAAPALVPAVNRAAGLPGGTRPGFGGAATGVQSGRPGVVTSNVRQAPVQGEAQRGTVQGGTVQGSLAAPQGGFGQRQGEAQRAEGQRGVFGGQQTLPGQGLPARGGPIQGYPAREASGRPVEEANGRRDGSFGDRRWSGVVNGPVQQQSAPQQPVTQGYGQRGVTPNGASGPGQQVSSPGRQEVFGNGAPGRQQVFQSGAPAQNGAPVQAGVPQQPVRQGWNGGQGWGRGDAGQQRGGWQAQRQPGAPPAEQRQPGEFGGRGQGAQGFPGQQRSVPMQQGSLPGQQRSVPTQGRPGGGMPQGQQRSEPAGQGHGEGGGRQGGGRR